MLITIIMVINAKNERVHKFCSPVLDTQTNKNKDNKMKENNVEYKKTRYPFWISNKSIFVENIQNVLKIFRKMIVEN